MKKLGRRARKRRHLQRAKQVASNYETPPGYSRTKTKLEFKISGHYLGREFVVSFSRDGGPSVGSFRWRKNQKIMADITEALK